MIIKASDKNIRCTGRWNITEKCAESTANGSYFEFCYYGECAVMCFDVSNCKTPFPHLYISVDNGANIEASVDKFIRISAEEGKHYVRVIMKGSVENQERWSSPIEAVVRLMNIQADDFSELEEDNRKVIEFIGDSITEGISIDVFDENEEQYVNYGSNRDMVYWDDATAGYAWRTAKALNLRPVFMGYGCLGTTKCGAGNVPIASQSYTYYSNGHEICEHIADIIVINHGTNDRNAEKELLLEKYRELLLTVRNKNPKAKIFSLTPFSGVNADIIKLCVDKFNKEFDDNVCYINSTGWIPPEPLHPTRQGHKVVSEKLVNILKKSFE